MQGTSTSNLQICRFSRSISLSELLLIIIFVILFVPKINVLPLGGLSIQIKPEDIMWMLMLPFIFFRKPNFSDAIRVSWFMLLLYLATSILWFPNNFFLALRYFFYSFPIIYTVVLSEKHKKCIQGLIYAFLIIMLFVSILQHFLPFPYLHTGELGIGPITRSPGIFGNGIEFALVAFYAFWLLVIMGNRSILVWLMVLTIITMTESRMVMAMQLMSFLVFMEQWPLIKKLSVGLVALVIVICVVNLAPDLIKTRAVNVNPLQVVTDFYHTISSATSKNVVMNNTDGYCFEFNNSLSADQSLAMRLSKVLFVIEYVILGSHKLGFGLGQCIGDAGDNLYIRMLSDGGLPCLFLLLSFIITLFCFKPKQSCTRKTWVLFITVFTLTSLFYDSLYFSRVAPLIFIIINLALTQRKYTEDELALLTRSKK